MYLNFISKLSKRTCYRKLFSFTEKYKVSRFVGGFLTLLANHLARFLFFFFSFCVVLELM